MKKKEYLKPAMRVELIQQDEQLLAGSGFGAGRGDYGVANDGVTSDINSDGEWEWN